MMVKIDFDKLLNFLEKVPGLDSRVSCGQYDDYNWWVKFQIDITHDFAWQVVQEFGYVLNNLSLNEKLPVAFYPLSAPPYLNGGPADFLYWIIESKEKDFLPSDASEWLEGRLPNPVDNLDQWAMDEDE